MLAIQWDLTPAALRPHLDRFFSLAGPKILNLATSWDPGRGSPVFTAAGKYTSRGWTEWTQGFQYGCALLHFDATGDEQCFEFGRGKTLECMAPHVSHIGVHDHGFNNISTYGNLLRLARTGRFAARRYEVELYELALKLSGAVQASRWTALPGEAGFIHSFNGPHSLFVDTIRSLRSLVVSHLLGHALLGEQDEPVNLLARSLQHAETTARYNVFFGTGRDRYDVRGRVAHEAIFNGTNGTFRCVNSQQGYSPFTTWSRGHAWVLSGFAEQLEFLHRLDEAEFSALRPSVFADKERVVERFESVARATADFYLDEVPTDGIPYWDYGAPELPQLGNYRDRPAEPENDREPVDSSAAAIAAQGLLRLGNHLFNTGEQHLGTRYLQAGLSVASVLLQPPYLSLDPEHEGLLLHSVYHRPNGWDHIPPGASVPFGESSMWGDYHLMELALYLLRQVEGQPRYTFFAGLAGCE